MSFPSRRSSQPLTRTLNQTITPSINPLATLTDDERRAQRKRQLASLLANANKVEETKTPDTSAADKAALIEEARRNRMLLAEQQRDAARNERRRTADERQRAKDQQAREALLKREQEAEAKRISDQKAESDRRREELEARQLAEEAAAHRRSINALKLSLAVQHRALVVVIRDVWLPWRQHVNHQRQQRDQADLFLAHHRQLTAVKHMRSIHQSITRSIALRKEQQCRQAEDFALKSCLSRFFSRWQQTIKQSITAKSEAMQFYQHHLLYQHIDFWIKQMKHRESIKNELLQQIEMKAVRMHQISTMKRSINQWKLYLHQQQEEKMKQKMKDEMLQKVNGWLKDYKQGAVT